jgi:hypothetical protein
MADRCQCKQAITAAFEDVALALGGVVAAFPIPDEATWDFARALEVIHDRARARCGTTDLRFEETADDEPHPAIIHLLCQLHERSAACCAPRPSERGEQ